MKSRKDIFFLPARMTSTPAGNHRSPGRSSRRTVLAGRVRKYSASSTWVPSLSRTSRTGSPTDTPSLSRPRCTNSSRLPTTSPLRTLRRPSHSLKGLFPRDSCNTQQHIHTPENLLTWPKIHYLCFTILHDYTTVPLQLSVHFILHPGS